MILSTFQSSNKSANVCKIAGEYEVMFYLNNNYIDSQIALTEQQAENIAEDWVILND